MVKKITLGSLANEQLEATKNFLFSKGKKRSLREEFRLFYQASKMPFLISAGIVMSYDVAAILSNYLFK